MGGLDGARGAQRVLPALNAVLPGQRFQLLRRRQPRAAEVVFADLAAREEQLGEADAAHAAAFRQQRLEVFADHQLGGSAADVDHQLAAFLRLSVLHAHEDQARFFLTGDDFDRVGDHFGGALEEHFGVHRLTQGVRPDDGDVIRREALQPFGKQGQQAVPRSIASSLSTLLLSNPSARCTRCFKRPNTCKAPLTTRAITMWKLFDPRSMAAISCGLFVAVFLAA